MPVVAIDGPAGAGKSTLARGLAERLGLERLDTGAMYRAVTLLALRRGIGPEDPAGLGRLAEAARIEVGERVCCDGEDITNAIREEKVTAAVSAVAAVPAVRAALVARQRAWVAERGAGVVEGRDIGSIVLPEADLKVFLTASSGTRAERRAGELGEGSDASTVEAALVGRDRLDSEREDSPLLAAADAVVIDSTGRDAATVLEEVLALL